MTDFRYSAGVDVNLNIKGASSQLQDLWKQLQKISNMKVDIGTGNLTADIEKASEAAMKLSAHLATAMNPRTGNLDFTKFYTSIQKSGASLQEYGEALQRMGPAGQKAFVSLADSISKSEIPLKRTSQMVDKMWDGLKRTAGWQLQSSIIHGIMGSIQSAVGYAKDLNSSLNDIRIVTGQSTEQMAQFAKQANQAAKNLSTTTTDYTKASLIYYQQGLSDAEVKQRTEATIKMANVSGQSAQNVSSQMTAIWNNFDNGSKSLQYYGDVITALGAKTASSSEEIAQGIQKFAAISDTIGLSYEYAASALATVTATTRESADVVGNAYKTLFSRIQGLNLGETLDDGTTLNKYSAALAKVGISIKDSSGNLKDMDSILNEMGSKWETLSKDQQMGLAQTVAGVRQYTQLVALMDNWDTFQQNLQIAKTSSGTLDAQAAIYAESWEAASDRVRTSWEGLWDTMINSDSMITMLDGLSGIIEAMNTLASSMGGAGGVLTSFLGIATKLFAPKLSQGLRDTAYNVSMLFGVEEKIKKARNTVLDNALKTLDADSEFGDLYGQNEAEARRAAMKSQVQASLDYAENYNNMTPLQHQIEQQYAQATRIQDERTAEAGSILDTAKNARYDAWANLTHTDVGGSVDNLLEFNRRDIAKMATEDIKAANQRKELTRDEFLQRQQAAQRFKDSTSKEKTAPITKEVLGNFSTALTDFYKIASGPEAGKATNYLDNLRTALNNLEQTGYKDDSSKKIIEKMRAKINGATEGIALDFTDDYQQLIKRQGKLAGGSEFGNLFTAWLEKEFNVNRATFEYDTEKKRSEGLRSGREKNLDGTKNIDWADTRVNAGEGALLALSAGQSLTALGESINKGSFDAISGLISIVSALSSVAMAAASFKTILSGVSVAIKGITIGSGGLGWIIAIATTLLPAIVQFIDHIHISDKERAAQEAKTQSELNNAYRQAENRHQNLIKSIDAYGEAQDALTRLTAGTTEWTNSLYEANKAAMNIISANNLTEGKDYYRDPSGLLKINQSTLDNIEKVSETSLDTVEAANRLKQLDSSSDNKENLSQELLTEFSNHPIWDILEKWDTGETLSKEEQAILDSKRLEGNHYMTDSSYSQDIISAITAAYLKNSGALDSTESIYKALAQEGYSIVSDIVIDSIYAMRDSIKASTANIQEQYENEAREFLSDESYSNRNEVMAASGRLLMNEYNKVKENYDNNYKEWAQQYAKATGLSKLKDFQIGSTDANGNVKYTYTDENGNPVTNQTMDKGAIQQYQIASITLTNLENSANQLDAIFTSLNAKGDEADGALASYIAEKGFGKATLEEMQALTGALNSQENKVKAIENATGLNEEQQKKISELEGVTYETWINGLIDNLTKATTDAIPYADRVKTRLGAQATANEDGSISWNWQDKDNLSNFVNGLNVENLKLLDSTLTNIKAMEGQSGLDPYVNALTGLIESADDVDSNSLIQMLLNLENTGSAAGNLQAIQAIIEGLGGSFEGATSAAQTFAVALTGINTSGLDGILSKLSQIKNALGDVFNLETGSNVNEDIYNNIIKALPELEGLFTEDILNGGYRYTGSKESARGVAREAYLATGNDIANLQEWSKDTAQGWNNRDNETLDMSDWGDEIASEFARDNIEATQAGVQNEKIETTGNALEMFRLLAAGSLGQGALDAVINQQKGINSAGDITQVLSDYQDNMQLMANLMNNVTETNGDGVIDYRDIQDASKQKQYLDAQEAATTAQAILSNIWSLIEQLADPEGLENTAKDFESTKGQLAEDTDQLADMYKVNRWIQENGDISFRDINGKSLSEGSEVIKNYASNLVLMGQQYDYSRESAIALNEAISDGNLVLAESLMQQTELETAIAQTAEARGLDADALASQIDRMEEKGYFDDDANGDGEKNYGKGLSAKDKAKMAADTIEEAKSLKELNEQWSKLSANMNSKEFGKADESLNKIGDLLANLTRNAQLAKMSTLDLQKGYQNFVKEGGKMSKVLAGNREEITKLARFMTKADWESNWKDMFPENDLKASGKSINNWKDAVEGMATAAQKLQEQTEGIDEGLITTDDYTGGGGEEAAQEWLNGLKQTWLDAYNIAYEGCGNMEQAMATATANTGIEAHIIPADTSGAAETPAEPTVMYGVRCVHGCHGSWTYELVETEVPGASPVEPPSVNNIELTKLGDAPKSGGGGGGGGGGKGAKEPKKVANKRKSQTVKRYKKNDYKRKLAEKVVDSEENKKDYLYGESKIAQMQKINKLAEKEARITADRIKESREYLVEDRQNLIKYLQKYGFEAEFDTDGFLASYEKTWNKLYQEIAALYEDNLLTEEEEKIEEDLNIKLEELEGVLEDYENSLSELADDIEAYEESLFEMYDNKVEALEHKVEFKIELSEDDLEYLDFWIESLGDNIYNAIEAIEAMGAKANALFDGLETYQQGIMDIMSLSEDPLQVWATGGIEGILTQAQVDALRDNRDGLADYMQQLIDLRDEIKDKVLDTFDDWQEKLDSTLTTIEHYTSVLEHFKNMIDVVGKDSLGLNDQFMANLEQSAINQSLDSIDANKAYYDNLVEIQQEAQEKLEEARARGDQSSADHWEEVVQSTTEAMQETQDALLTSLEDSLNLIAEQFEANMERAVETFNDALYAYGGLEGLSNDYDRIRENADLMAADYEKIYELSKINRNINKTLDDTKIIAGKQRLKSLQKEINDLQNSGVELSKYDLEYLQAKYELRLAEIELENAQNAKSTVRLSKDNEGNWSYIYTQNAEDVEESYQKYEDALYKMQKLSQEYLEEMSSTMLDTSSAMMEEIQNLRIQDFNSYEEYQKEIKHIQDKYAESLRLQENELNKAVSNSQQIYEQDWRNYNLITGYKISDSEKWADAFRESTIGQLLNSDSIVSSFSDTILGLTDILTKNLSNSAVSYFDNIDKAFASYGTSIEDFGKHVEDTTEKISNKSKKAVEDAKSMASEMNDAFKEIAETVADWQEEFSLKIDEMLEKIKTLIQDINTAIETSAKYNKDNNGAENLIGSQEAIELLNQTGKFGQWFSDGSVGVKVDGKATNFVDYNAALIEEIDDAVERYANAKTGSNEREKYGEQLKELFKRYWEYRDIVNRVYDPTNLTTNMAAPTFTSMDTGGYTGEWGDAGKFAMLHEKELVLNKDDTKNFLDALNISREVINSMIEMNARQSSLALGDLMPMSIQDTSQVLEQSVTIQAEFPNATDRNEIEEAFNNLINTASQYANRYND